jgi:hypothetical protein
MLPVSNPVAEGGHFFILGPGNNKEIIEEILSKREGWLPTSTIVLM